MYVNIFDDIIFEKIGTTFERIKKMYVRISFFNISLNESVVQL